MIEAKYDNVDHAALLAKYNVVDRTDSHQFKTGLDIAKHIYNVLNVLGEQLSSLYYDWVVDQYINQSKEAPVFLHDIEGSWKKTLEEFYKFGNRPEYKELVKQLKMATKIKVYKTYVQLVSAVTAAKQALSSGQGVVSFFDTMKAELDKFVHAGAARYDFVSNGYVVYHPLTWEASNIIKNVTKTTSMAARSMESQLCTTYNENMYNDYASGGYLAYTFVNGATDAECRYFLAYVKTAEDGKASEFADYQNNHSDYGLNYQFSRFPGLAKTLKDKVNEHSGLAVQLYIAPPEKHHDLCLSLVKKDGMVLENVPYELRDYEMCLAAVQQTGEVLEFIAPELRDYDKICLAAVHQNGGALRYVPYELRDYKMCLVAVQQNGGAVSYVPYELRDYKMCLVAVKQNGRMLSYVPKELRDYDKICLAAVKQNCEALWVVPKKLRDYDKICLAAVKQDESMLWYVPRELRDKVKAELGSK